MNYSMLSARDAAEYTTKNRERPIICILSCMEGRIIEAIKYRADAILYLCILAAATLGEIAALIFNWLYERK